MAARTPADLTITEAEVIVCSPGRNFVTLKLVTGDGIVGYGDATLNGRELAVASYLRDHVCPLLLGRDAGRIEDTWQYLYRGAYWRRGPVTMTAIGAVDLALWDVLGRALGVPVHRLLGGACRDGVPAYAHATGRTVDETLSRAAGLVAEGFRAVRLQAAVPGLRDAYGVGDGDGRYEPAVRATDLAPRPVEEQWDTEPYLRFVPLLFAAAREALGPDLALMHDVHHRLTPSEAGALGRQLEPYRPAWLEDPTPAEWQPAFRAIRAHTTVPLATGEIFNSVHDAHALIAERLIDYLRMAPSHGGGLTALKKVAGYAEMHQVRLACHGPSDISPVGLAAALHLGLSTHNVGWQEWMGHPTQAGEVFRSSYKFEGGLLHPGEAPGLGVEVDEAAAARLPYRPAYLPVARRLDGSVHDW